VETFTVCEVRHVDGFVLFDTVNRYEIDFPNGWEKRAKQAADKK
jgi:hypothetical protein